MRASLPSTLTDHPKYHPLWLTNNYSLLIFLKNFIGTKRKNTMKDNKAKSKKKSQSKRLRSNKKMKKELKNMITI